MEKREQQTNLLSELESGPTPLLNESGEGYCIYLDVEQDGWKNDIPEYMAICRAAVNATLDHMFAKAGMTLDKARLVVSIVLSDDAVVQDYNRQYRGKDKPTNVLSFPSVFLQPDDLGALEQDLQQLDRQVVLGDMILAYETVKREAQEQEKTVENHAIHLVVHSTLHLLGYDHEEISEATRMEALEVEILATLGVENPYENAAGMPED